MRRILVSAIVLGALAVLVGLGLWQLDRRGWKQALLADLDAQLAAPPISLESAPTEDLAWRRAKVHGTWITAKPPARIRSRTLHGQAGADFAAPFQLANGDALIVRLGWMRDPSEPPTLPAGQATIEGVLFPTPRPTAFTPDNTPPDRWLWLAPKPIAVAAGLPAAKTSPLALNLQDALAPLIARPARPSVPNDHLQYAMTWFSLAAALLATVFFATRRRRSS